MLKFINRPREGENTFLIICVLAESATWPVCLFLICQFISFFILLFFSKRSSKFSMELYQSKSEKFRRRCWMVSSCWMVQEFTVYVWKAKHIYYATTRLLPKETESGLYYFNFESDLFLYVFNCSANSLSMLFYFKFFFDAFRTPHCAFDRRSVCNRTVNGFEDWTFFISLTKQLYQQK